MDSCQVVVELKPSRGRVALVRAEVIDGILEDIWPRGVSGVVCYLFHPYHESGSIVFLVCDAEGCIDSEGREKGMQIRERRLKFGLSYHDLLLSSVDVCDYAVDCAGDVIPACVFVSEEFGEVVNFKRTVRDGG